MHPASYRATDRPHGVTCAAAPRARPLPTAMNLFPALPLRLLTLSLLTARRLLARCGAAPRRVRPRPRRAPRRDDLQRARPASAQPHAHGLRRTRPDYWQQRVDYVIDVTLEPGHTNDPRRRARHLPQPLARRARLPLGPRRAERAQEDSIGALVMAAAPSAARRRTTDGVTIAAVTHDGAPLAHHVYDTMMRVHLPTALAPGRSITLGHPLVVRGPRRVFRRYGTLEVEHGTIWELARGSRRPPSTTTCTAGTRCRTWATGEFYTNFGDYQLNITAPRDHLVVASACCRTQKRSTPQTSARASSRRAPARRR